MSTLDEKLSQLVKYQLPDFVRDNYETFQTFLVKYYEFSEQNTQVQYNIQKAKSFADIDETTDAFVEYFLSQYAYNLPKSIFLDQLNQVDGLVFNSVESKRAIAKRLTDYHGNKGNEGAIRLLFRLLFDEEIVFYYPKEDIFRPSDSDWEVTKTIFLYTPETEPKVINVSDYGGSKVTGLQSGASAVLDSLFSLKYPLNTPPVGNVVLYEMKIMNDTLSGTFDLGEVVQLTTGNLTTGGIDVVANVKFYNVISSFDIVDPGTGLVKDSPIYMIPVGDENFIGTITNVGRTGQIERISINYPIDLENEYNNQSNISLILLSGLTDYPGKFESTNDTSNVARIILTESGNSITHGLYKGNIANIEFTSGIVSGPNSFVVNSVISNKMFTVSNSLITPGVTGNVILKGRQANINPILGAIASYSGSFVDKNSHVSDIKRIQDSNYWQDYSYVIRANQSSYLWKDIIKKNIHPAGLKLISEVFLQIANAFTATSVIPPLPFDHVLLRIQITTPIPADIPTSVLNQYIMEVVSKPNRNYFKHSLTRFYNKSFDKFKFYNTTLKIQDVSNVTFDFVNQEGLITVPEVYISSEVYNGQANIILNSNFLTSSNWTLPPGITITNGNLSATTATGNVIQSFTANANAKYMATYEVLSSSAGTIALAANSTSSMFEFIGTNRSSPGKYIETFWIPSTTANIKLVATGFTGNVSNVYVKKLGLIKG